MSKIGVCMGLILPWILNGSATVGIAKPPSIPINLARRNCTAIARILSVENLTSLPPFSGREGGNNPQFQAGELVCAEDTLQLSTNANVTVLCYGNGELQQLPSGISSTITDLCPPVLAEESSCPETDKEGQCHSDRPRGPFAGRNTPDIIRPFDNSNLAEVAPALSWYAVTDATAYIVRIEDISGVEASREWQSDASEFTSDKITVDYPFSQPLQPGKTYQAIVEVVLESGRVPPEKAIFTLLSAEELERVRLIEEKLEALQIPTEEKVLQDLYPVYLHKNLMGEAIASLESLAETQSDNPLVYLRLGGLYWRQGLLDLARDRYQNAVDFATAAGDTEALAKAQLALEKINAEIEKQTAL